MMSRRPTLYLLCGKIASGKSTLGAALAEQPDNILLKEDELLATLYPGEIATFEDYRRCALRLREAMAPHIVDLLRRGLSVVLDFQANTPAARAWSLGLSVAAGADHRLYYLKAEDAVCKARLEERNAKGSHQYRVSEADYELFTRYFVPPEESEGLEIEVRRQQPPST